MQKLLALVHTHTHTHTHTCIVFEIMALGIFVLNIIKIKSVAYSSQGSHTGQLDFCKGIFVYKKKLKLGIICELR